MAGLGVKKVMKKCTDLVGHPSGMETDNTRVEGRNQMMEKLVRFTMGGLRLSEKVTREPGTNQWESQPNEGLGEPFQAEGTRA